MIVTGYRWAWSVLRCEGELQTNCEGPVLLFLVVTFGGCPGVRAEKVSIRKSLFYEAGQNHIIYIRLHILMTKY